MKVESMEKAVQTASVKPVTAHTNEKAVNEGKTETKPQRASLVSANSKKTGEDALNDKEQEKGRMVAESTVREAISSANRKMTSARCEFSYHEGTRRVSIKVIDKDSDEVIREIPPEKSLDMLQKLWEAAGLFVDEQK